MALSKIYNPWKTIYQLKISLCIDEEDEISPKIWRRVYVDPKSNFVDLKSAVELALGWIKISEYRFVVPVWGQNTRSNDYVILKDENVSISQFLSLIYRSTYLEMIDSGEIIWEHEIYLEAIIPQKVDCPFPHCIAGKGACPPLQCKGPQEYKRICEIIKNPDHEDYETTIGTFGLFDPSDFYVQNVNILFEIRNG